MSLIINKIVRFLKKKKQYSFVNYNKLNKNLSEQQIANLNYDIQEFIIFENHKNNFLFFEEKESYFISEIDNITRSKKDFLEIMKNKINKIQMSNLTLYEKQSKIDKILDEYNFFIKIEEESLKLVLTKKLTN